MIDGNSTNQGGRNGKALERLVATFYGASPETRSNIVETMQMVADAYPGQDVQSWVTIGRMRDAVSGGNVADYNAARGADPNGKLARIVGVIYARNPVKNGKNLETFMELESSYIAGHPDKF